MKPALWMAGGLILMGAAGEPRMRGVKMKELNEASAGQAVTLSSGERMRVTLKESGGTGYRWEAGADCPKVLRLEEEARRPGAVARPGAGGERMWVYTAVGEGVCDLSFRSVRSWEKSGAGKTVTFAVTVVKRA